MQVSSIDKDEVAKFSAMAAEWWDLNGNFAPLHKFNPVRLGFIRDTAAAHFGRDTTGAEPFKGLRLLDIGCGGGLLSEPMARLGFDVLGADASEQNIKTAAVHAAEQGVAVDYRATTAEALAEAGEQFDIVLNMEVVEHVANPRRFLRDCADMVKPGGLMICATLNRTPRSLLMAKIGAEYVLRWLPRGTHDWNKFITPPELERMLIAAGLDVTQKTGVTYSPFKDAFALSDRDLGVNYMMVGVKGA